MTSRSLQAWLTHLEQLHPTEIDLGLERIRDVADVLGLLAPRGKVVTVAGTNGKGSTVAVLEALLRERGLRVGAFTSPHLERYNERIRIDGRDLDDGAIVDAFCAIDEARQGVSLTYFEFAALAALWLFHRAAVDVMILEVGLGGRLDAVNIIDADIAVITSIALDHQAWLGDTREAIAIEKAGILRSGNPVVIAETDPPSTLMETAEAVGAEVVLIGRDFEVRRDDDTWSATLLATPLKEVAPQPLGSLLPQNIAAALQVVLLLGLTFNDAQIANALATAAPRGRRQCVTKKDVSYVLDVAHNPAAVEALAQFLQRQACQGKTIAIFSVMRDKDVGSIIAALIDVFDVWYLADQPDNERAADSQEIAIALDTALSSAQRDALPIETHPGIADAWQAAQCAVRPGDRVVVFGSFTTVGAVLPLLAAA